MSNCFVRCGFIGSPVAFIMSHSLRSCFIFSFKNGVFRGIVSFANTYITVFVKGITHGKDKSGFEQ